MARPPRINPKDEKALFTELLSPQYADDPYAFVLFCYPWGVRNTPLEDYKGPREWQKEYLVEIGEHLRSQKANKEIEFPLEMWRKATSSGRGPGKSALVSWLVHWLMSTRLGSTTIVAANTEAQLKSRTFAEIKKWLTLAINGHWFEASVLTIKPQPWFDQILKDQLKVDTGYYYAQGQLWSEENPDAFAGAHNPLGMQVIFDEASGIPAPIWTVTSGFFTEPVVDRYWHVFSNPRRNSGAFFDVFHNPDVSKQWRHRTIDSRTVEGTDRATYDAIIAEHGIDSDEARVEVLGQFPKQGDKQFIANDIVYGAQAREVVEDMYAPLIMGVDLARFGNDQSVIRFRQGRDARSIPPLVFKNRDNMFMANEIARMMDKYKPDAVNVDAGNGTGVIDRLREMGYRVNEVWFGSKADKEEWADKRTEMYADMRDWMKGGAIDQSLELFRDLTTPEYGFASSTSDKIRLESKEKMKARGVASPDHGDALALTFAKRIARKDTRHYIGRNRSRQAVGVDYRVFG